MNNQAKVTEIAEKTQSTVYPQSLSGQFRLADTKNSLKCLFWDAMHNNHPSSVECGFEAGADPFSILRFPHNGDSQLGTGSLKQHRPTLDFKRPQQAATA